jgi:biopolymer transport protein ExbB
MLSVLRLRGLMAVLAIALAISAAAPVASFAQTPPADPAPASAADVPSPAGIQAPSSTVAIDNPYGPEALWKNGDFVARGTLVILAIMSLSTWYVMLTKLYEQTRLFAQARSANRKFWTGTSVATSTAELKKGSPFRYIAESGVNAMEHHEGTMVEQIDLHSWVTMSIQRAADEVGSRLQGGLAVLATVGSTAPFVGLFGTVWGIYNALTAIGIAGQASIDKVAGPVGEALIMTAVGLFVAVPAVLGYNWLVRRNKVAMEKIRTFTADLHSVLLSGSRVADAPAISKAA